MITGKQYQEQPIAKLAHFPEALMIGKRLAGPNTKGLDKPRSSTQKQPGDFT
jgi:hypothetical protein